MKYNEEQLCQINMYSLRNIARGIGVKAPTGLNRQELMNQILQIDSGKMSPNVPSKKGRPPKTHIEYTRVEKIETQEKANDIRSEEEIKREIKEEIKKEIIDAVLTEVENKLIQLLSKI